MFHITIVAIGAIRSKCYTSLGSDYLKRLAPYAKIKIVELQMKPFKAGGQKVMAKTKEGERIMRFIKKQKGEIFVLDENGKEYSSELFAKTLNSINNHIIFVIGGALGLGDEVINYPSARRISFSKMTFTHEMVRVILLEQIYRAGTILRDRAYHY